MPLQRYRTRPVVVEAWWLFKADYDCWCGAITWVNANGGMAEAVGQEDHDGTHIIAISTLEGVMYADAGDYLIKGELGEFYPRKPDIFEATYEWEPSPTGTAGAGRMTEVVRLEAHRIEPNKSGVGMVPPVMASGAHTLTVHFDEGDREFVTLECHLTGPERACAVIACPEDHEDVSGACIETHGATALDECWAVQWFEAGGREALNTEAVLPVSVPVNVYYDEGVMVETPAVTLD